MRTPRTWKELERHPVSAAYPNLTGEGWARFVGELRKHGIIGERAITLHEGKVLDGWQLLRACIEADITPPFRELPQGCAPETFVEIMNDVRRHEDAQAIRQRAEARRARVAEMRVNGMSEREIAEK